MNKASQQSRGADGNDVCPSLFIDGHQVPSRRGETVFQACARTGVTLPAMCFSERLSPIGSCRLCLVEVDGEVRASCTTPAAAGLNIRTATPRLERLRATVLELLLSSVNSTLRSRTRSDRRPPAHPYIIEDMNRCVACLRCISACETLAGREVLAPHGRGIDLTIRARESDWLKSGCVTCNACVEECPTAALSAPGLSLPGALPVTASVARKTKRKTLQLSMTTIPAGTRDGLCLHPDDAAAIKAADHQPLEFTLNGKTVRAHSIVTARTPPGTAHWLVRDSMMRATDGSSTIAVHGIRVRVLSAAEAALPPDDSFDLRRVK